MDDTVIQAVERMQRDLGVGTAWLVVLGAVERASVGGGAVHGYELARVLAEHGGVAPKHGTLYPILRQMEAEGFLSSVLVPSTEGPARKCYRTTATGRLVLSHWIEVWQRTSAWVNGIVMTSVNGIPHTAPRRPESAPVAEGLVPAMPPPLPDVKGNE